MRNESLEELFPTLPDDQIKKLEAERGVPFWQKTKTISQTVINGILCTSEVYLPKDTDPDYDPAAAAMYKTEESQVLCAHLDYFGSLKVCPIEYPQDLLVTNEFGFPKLLPRWDYDAQSCCVDGQGCYKATRVLNLKKCMATFGWTEYHVKTRMVHLAIGGNLTDFSVSEFRALKFFQEFEKKRKENEAKKAAEAEAKERRRQKRENRQDESYEARQKRLKEQSEQEAKREAIEALLAKTDVSTILKLVEST